MTSLYTTTHTVQSPSIPVMGVAAKDASTRIRELVSELEPFVRRHTDLTLAIPTALELVRKAASADWSGVHTLGAGNQIAVVATSGELAKLATEISARELESLLLQSLSRGLPLGKIVGAASRRALAIVPVRVPGQPAVVVSALARLDGFELPALGMVLEYVAAALSQIATEGAFRTLEGESQALAATTELMDRIVSADSIEAAELLVVNELAAFLEARQVCLGNLRGRGMGVQMRAISGLSEFDKRSDAVRLLIAAMDESLVRGEWTQWPPEGDDDRHATLAHRRLVETGVDPRVASVPLTTRHGQGVGALLVLGGGMDHSAAARILRAMAPYLASALATRKKAEPSWYRRLWIGLLGEHPTLSRRTLVIAAIALVIGLLFLPIPHRIAAVCSVEPTIRRFVVAPYDGRLAESRVQPGDTVQAGQVIAHMDDRELRFELDALVAERIRAAKERDAMRVDHDTSGAQIAELEVERIDSKISVLRHREKNLDIVSPLTGVVLKGDLEDAQGAPVSVGQALFEIAPLEVVQLELAIPETDIGWVTVGQSIHARLEGFSGPSIHGTIDRVHPRAELRDGKNVFLAEVRLDNSQQEFRPGMNGQSWIRDGWRPLGWVWLHKAWHRLRIWTGW